MIPALDLALALALDLALAPELALALDLALAPLRGPRHAERATAAGQGLAPTRPHHPVLTNPLNPPLPRLLPPRL